MDIRLQAKFLVEFVHTATGVYQLLFACIKGVTFGADLHLNVIARTTRLNYLTASTTNCGLLVVWVDPLLHLCSPLSTKLGSNLTHFSTVPLRDAFVF